jgi:uncharacterized delta-60 repeat protein
MGKWVGGSMVVAVLAMTLATGGAASAALGDLDPSFGTGGVVFTQLGQGPTPLSQGIDLKLDPDGRIVVAGAASDANGDVAAALARYLPAGVFDPSFGPGGSGVVTTQFGVGAMPRSLFYFSGLALHPDGGIIGCGLSTDANGDGSTLIARFTAGGVLDPAFASGGKYSTQHGVGATPGSNFFGCDVQPDGKIVAVGGRTNSTDDTEVLAVRLTAGGVPDGTFDGDGVFTQQLSPNAATPTSVFADLVILPDGRMVVSLALRDVPGDTSIGIARLGPAGSIDPTFGSGGLTITSFGGPTPFSEGVQIGMQPGGKFVVSGDGEDGNGDLAFLMARYTEGGMLDPSFGNAGRVTSQLSPAGMPSSTGIGQVIQPDGKIVLAGSAEELDGTTALAIARYTSEGQLDATFGTSGVVKGQFGSGPTAFTTAIGGTFTPAGKLLVTGVAGTSGSDGLTWWVASFDADAPPTAAFTFAPIAPVVGEPVDLDGSGSTDPDGTVGSYAWDLDDDGEHDDATGAMTTTSFTTGGDHTVGLLVTDGAGVQGTATTVIAVGCGETVSYLSVDCRIGDLLASVEAQVSPGPILDKLTTALTTARSFAQEAEAAPPGKERKRALRKANKFMRKFMGAVRKAKELPKEERTALRDSAKGVRRALKGLRKI